MFFKIERRGINRLYPYKDIEISMFRKNWFSANSIVDFPSSICQIDAYIMKLKQDTCKDTQVLSFGIEIELVFEKKAAI